MGKEVDSLS